MRFSGFGLWVWNCMDPDVNLNLKTIWVEDKLPCSIFMGQVRPVLVNGYPLPPLDYGSGKIVDHYNPFCSP